MVKGEPMKKLLNGLLNYLVQAFFEGHAYKEA